MGDKVTLVSSADETANDVFKTLTEHDLLAPQDAVAQHRFFATGDEAQFAALARRFLGPEVQSVEKLHQ
jgi:glutamate racemase